MELINYLFAAGSIFFGLFGWLAPKYTMETVDLRPGDTSMGPSEIRAASGALFVGLGVGAFLIGTPEAYVMIGFAWGFAGLGRLTSLILDGQTRKKWTFFAIEILVGIVSIYGNLIAG